MGADLGCDRRRQLLEPAGDRPGAGSRPAGAALEAAGAVLEAGQDGAGGRLIVLGISLVLDDSGIVACLGACDVAGDLLEKLL